MSKDIGVDPRNKAGGIAGDQHELSLIHISEPTRP